MGWRQLLASGLALASFASAQFPPKPEGLTKKESTRFPGVSITYKETSICETKARGWAGHVHMPVSYLQDIESADPYNISMFFWYFEAREDPQSAPLGIYLAGGPGQSSLWGAASDGGPCYIGSDSNSTYDNPWSMNNHINMLYVDQPVGTGFSYDVLLKSTNDLLFAGSFPETGTKAFEDYDDKIPADNTTFLYGVFPSQNPLHTANTTGVVAVTLWHFAQAWISDFSEYKTCDSRVTIW